MSSIAHSPVTIQTSAQSVPATPCWFGEVTGIAHFLKRQGVLSAIEEQVRFARRRFGHYDTIDFVAVLLGYAISGERTLEAFYERVQPFAGAFMALLGRNCLPHRSTLSRYLAVLEQPPVEALRTLFLNDVLARPLEKEKQPGGLWDRQGTHYLVFDVDGTRQPLANVLYPVRLILRPPNAGWMRSALRAIWGASELRSSGRAQPFCKLTRTSGSARSPGYQGRAMAITEETSGRP